MMTMVGQKCFLCAKLSIYEFVKKSEGSKNDERTVDESVEVELKQPSTSSIHFLIQSVLRIKIDDIKDSVFKSIMLCSKCLKDLISLHELAKELSRLEAIVKALSDGMVNSVIKSLVQSSQGNEGEEVTNFALTIGLQNLRKIPLHFEIYKKWRSRFVKVFNSTYVRLTKPSTSSTSVAEEARSCALDNNVIAVDCVRSDLQEIQNALSHDHSYGVVHFDLSVPANVIATVSNDDNSTNSAKDQVEPKHFYECQVCNRKFRRQTTLKEHIKNGHNDMANYCNKCNLHLSNHENFIKHMDDTHQEIQPQLCGLCMEPCESGFSLCKACRDVDDKLHIKRKIHRPRFDTADDNDVLNSTSQRPSRNKKRPNRFSSVGVKSVICQHCQKTFRKKRDLKCHIRTHTGERPYQCDHCKKPFIDKRQLKIHSRIHTGEKPYICELCGTGFSSLAGFHSHRKTHAKLKPYSCGQCSGKFRSSGQLRKHQLIHTGERPFTCTICQKSFNRKENLRTHEFTHATLKPHKCSLCPQSFIRSFLLRKHILEQHAEPVTSLVPTGCPPNSGSESFVGLQGPVNVMTFDVFNPNQSHSTVTSTNINTGSFSLIPEAVFIADSGEQYIIYK